MSRTLRTSLLICFAPCFAVGQVSSIRDKQPSSAAQWCNAGVECHICTYMSV
jgi:hypothetical protein